MGDAEMDIWSRWALPARVDQVKRCARVARDDWRRRARDPQEALDSKGVLPGHPDRPRGRRACCRESGDRGGDNSAPLAWPTRRGVAAVTSLDQLTPRAP